MGLFAGTKWDLPAHCDRCGSLESDCQCPAVVPVSKAASAQSLRVRVEKRKAGRIVTIITGLDDGDANSSELLTRLKNACGAGGSLEAANLVIQGDQQSRAIKLLQEIGYRIS